MPENKQETIYIPQDAPLYRSPPEPWGPVLKVLATIGLICVFLAGVWVYPWWIYTQTTNQRQLVGNAILGHLRANKNQMDGIGNQLQAIQKRMSVKVMPITTIPVEMEK